VRGAGQTARAYNTKRGKKLKMPPVQGVEMLLIGLVGFAAMAAFYGLILWLVYRIATSLERISRGMEEVTRLVSRGVGQPDEPPR